MYNGVIIALTMDQIGVWSNVKCWFDMFSYSSCYGRYHSILYVRWHRWWNCLKNVTFLIHNLSNNFTELEFYMSVPSRA